MNEFQGKSEEKNIPMKQKYRNIHLKSFSWLVDLFSVENELEIDDLFAHAMT